MEENKEKKNVKNISTEKEHKTVLSGFEACKMQDCHSERLKMLDYFAGQAIIGMMVGDAINIKDVGYVAHNAYRMAQAMLEERSKHE